MLAAAHNTYKAEDSDSSLAYFERFLDDPLLLSCPIYTRDDAFDMLRSIYKDADRARICERGSSVMDAVNLIQQLQTQSGIWRSTLPIFSRVCTSNGMRCNICASPSI